jgi:TatD DNase family protein
MHDVAIESTHIPPRSLVGVSYTDSHCHLYDTRGVPVEDVIAAAQTAGVSTMVNVGCDAATTAQAIAVAALHDGIYATAGLHPHEAKHGVDTIVQYLDDPNIIAIGECGLDYFYDHSPRDEQRAAFAAQIQLAHERSLPLVIHTRDAWAETFDILDAEGVPERTVFHCFSGGPDEATRCLQRDAFLSFSGIVTFKTATDLHSAARLCPLDRLLAETDSPYLAPVPHRGKPNQPAYVTHVVQALAKLRGAALDDVRGATVANASLAFPGIRP